MAPILHRSRIAIPSIILAVAAFSATPANAQETAPAAPAPEAPASRQTQEQEHGHSHDHGHGHGHGQGQGHAKEHGGEHGQNDHGRHHRRGSGRWVFAPGLRYYKINNFDAVAGAFSSNGLPEFDDNSVGLSLLFYYRTQTEWQLGFVLDSLGTMQESGTSTGEFNSGRLGAWVGKDLLPGSPVDVTPGTYLGLGYSELLILSGAADGRISESFGYVEPTLTMTYAVSPRVKIGVSASYLASVDLSTENKGDSLGIGTVSPKAWSVQAQLIFGRF